MMTTLTIGGAILQPDCRSFRGGVQFSWGRSTFSFHKEEHSVYLSDEVM